MKKVILYAIQFLLIPAIAFAVGKASVSDSNMTAIPVAGINSSGEMVVLKVDNDGIVQTTCVP